MNFFYNDYKFKDNKNYLIFFRGNFGPCSRGHFSLVEKYIHLPNVKYLISQIGSEKRHGVPYYFNKKIWKIYLNLLPKEKIYFEKAYSTSDILNFIDDIDIVIFLRGNEDSLDERDEKEKERIKRYSTLREKLKEKNVKLDFLIIDRPEKDTLSSTKLIESILQKKSLNKLKFYFPDDLSSEDLKYIVKKLKSFPIHV